MSTKPKIVRTGDVVRITAPFPLGYAIGNLLPYWGLRSDLNIKLDLITSSDNNHFMVLISCSCDTGHFTDSGCTYFNPEQWDENVRWIIQYVWDQLVELDVVTGCMPKIVIKRPIK
ncbi:MAG TPA: hypothetical protein VGE13_01375 [Candidatus Saccharimonadales bacterium]